MRDQVIQSGTKSSARKRTSRLRHGKSHRGPIRTLTADHREVIVFRFYFDLTVEQIAARTGVGAGTVKSRLHYALKQLRSAVEPSLEGSPAR